MNQIREEISIQVSDGVAKILDEEMARLYAFLLNVQSTHTLEPVIVWVFPEPVCP